MNTGVYLFRDGIDCAWYACDKHTADSAMAHGFEVVSLDEARIGGKQLCALLVETQLLISAVMNKRPVHQADVRHAWHALQAYLELLKDGGFHEPTQPVRRRVTEAETTADRRPVDVAPRTPAGCRPARRAARG